MEAGLTSLPSIIAIIQQPSGETGRLFYGEQAMQRCYWRSQIVRAVARLFCVPIDIRPEYFYMVFK
jgi:hypothetical protein